MLYLIEESEINNFTFCKSVILIISDTYIMCTNNKKYPIKNKSVIQFRLEILIVLYYYIIRNY